MTRIELIEFIGDFLTKLDVFIGKMLPGDKERKPFEKARDELDDMLLKLRKKHFEAGTQEFKKATDELTSINKDLKKTIVDLDKMVETMATVTRFIGAVDKIIQTFIP